MPTYDYECSQCGHAFEAQQSMRDDPLSVCPSCSEPALRRVISGGAGIIFKGSGFYVTDSKKSGGSSAKPSSTGKESSGSGEGSPASSSGSTSTDASSGKKTTSGDAASGGSTGKKSA